MAKVAYEIEHNYPERKISHLKKEAMEREVTDSITEGVVRAADDVDAKAIIALTETGYTARMVSRFKPTQMILSLTPNEVTFHQLSLSFGCVAVKIPSFKSFEEVLKYAKDYCVKNKIAKKGDSVVITGGIPFNKKSCSTNMVMVETI